MASPSGPSGRVNTVHGQAAVVLKLHVLVAASGLPATSVTPAPRSTVAVKVRPSASAADGVSVILRVGAS